MKDEWKAHKNTKFVICDRKIELRYDDGQFIASVCCIKCVKQLEKAIKHLRESFKERKQ